MRHIIYFFLFLMACGCKDIPSKNRRVSIGDTLQFVSEKHGDTTLRYTIRKGKNTDSVWHLSGWDTSQAYIKARWPTYYYIGGIKGNRFNDSTVAVEFTEWLKKRDKNYNPSVGRLYDIGDKGNPLPSRWVSRNGKYHWNTDPTPRSHYDSTLKFTIEPAKKKEEEWLEIGDQQDGGVNTIYNAGGTSLISESNVLLIGTRSGGELKIKMNLPDSSLTISGDTTGIIKTLYDLIFTQSKLSH